MLTRLILAAFIAASPAYLAAAITVTGPAGASKAAAGSRISIPFDIAISSGYIYGNPVGPGIGKPTVVTVAPDPSFTVERIDIEAPQKYYPENTPEWVYRYMPKARFYVTVATTKNFTSATMRVTVDALNCTDASCTPAKANAEHRISLSPDAAAAAPIPAGYQRIEAAAPASTAVTNAALPYTFTPRPFETDAVSGLLLAVLLGFVAGLILNVMPCVLPVVGLKLIAFIRASGESRSRLALTGLSYTGGVFLSFIALSALVYGGMSWGALFQSRYFIAVMTLIVFGMSLSLFGLYTFILPFNLPAGVSSKNQFISAFYYGLIATLLATPCSGPFLGGTLAWTATQGYGVIFPVFMSIAAGFSFPYILITLFPRLVSFLPRPGNWTITLEKLLGFLLAGTAVYLTSIYVSSYGTMLLWSLFILTFALFIYGNWGTPEKSFSIRLTTLPIVIILIVGSLVILGREDTYNARGAEYAGFSVSALEKNTDSGAVVIVDFTADWCPNCYFVEKTVLGKEEVTGFIKNNGMVLMKADMTSPGTEAERLLNALGSYSIPFLAVFVPGKGFTSPYTLRDIYTEDELLALLARAKTEADEARKNSSPAQVENFSF